MGDGSEKPRRKRRLRLVRSLRCVHFPDRDWLHACCPGRCPTRGGRCRCTIAARIPGSSDPAPGAGRVMREPLLILGAGRALLMQAAHPLVAQGAIDHSAYATDPFGRLERTIEWVTLVSFGTTAEAREISQRVLRVHKRIAGVLPEDNATPYVTPGRA